MTENETLVHEIQGGLATAIVYGNYPDLNELKQIFQVLDCPAFEGAAVRIMPDHHAGAGCVIGFTADIDHTHPRVVPNVVGVDIGCGVAGIALTEYPTNQEQFLAFDKHLRANVPAGFNVRTEPHRLLEPIYDRLFNQSWDVFRASLERLAKKVDANPSQVLRSVGTLGGGNHFIELDREVVTDLPVQDTWLVVHSGSRNFGLKVAKHHQHKASKLHPRGDLSWLDGDDAREYLADMRLCQEMARLNRHVMLYVLSEHFTNRAHTRMDLLDQSVESVHNYIGPDDTVRKGAVSAREDETVIIPWNMRDGLIIGRGKGNGAWNDSAPHGAGRAMGRNEAKRTLSMDSYREAMAGIWSSCVTKETLDEAPDAYKPADSVEAALEDTVVVDMRLKPIYNFKASEDIDKKRAFKEAKTLLRAIAGASPEE